MLMKQSNLWILCGPPGCGKSTWANKQDGIIISRDAIRFSLLKEDDDYFSHEDEVMNTFISKIKEALQENENVYADATHLGWTARNKVISRLGFKDINVYAVVFTTSVLTCLYRNERRSGRAKVPATVVKKMFYSYKDPKNDPYNYAGIIYIDADGNEVRRT